MFIVTKLVRRFLISLLGPDLSRTHNPDRVFIFFEKIMVHMYTVCTEFDDDFTIAALLRFFKDHENCHLKLQGTVESNSLARYWYNRFHTTQKLVFIVLHMTDEFDPDTSCTNPHKTYQCIPFTDLPKATQFYEMQEVSDWHLHPEYEWVGNILFQMLIHVGSSMFSEALRNDELITQESMVSSSTSPTTPTPPQSPKRPYP